MKPDIFSRAKKISLCFAAGNPYAPDCVYVCVSKSVFPDAGRQWNNGEEEGEIVSRTDKFVNFFFSFVISLGI